MFFSNSVLIYFSPLKSLPLSLFLSHTFSRSPFLPVQTSELQLQQNLQSLPGKQLVSLQVADFHATFNQEMLYQLMTSLKLKEGQILFERLVVKNTTTNLKTAFIKWNNFIKEANTKLMESDKVNFNFCLSNILSNLQCSWYLPLTLSHYI